MNPNAGLFRWCRVALPGLFCFLFLPVNSARGDALEDWTAHTFPQTFVNCIAFGGTTYLSNAVPILWKVLSHHGAFVAAGTGPCDQDTPTVILRSTDGVNWSKIPNQGYNGFFGATVTPDYIVEVGFWGETQLSPDGVTWTYGGYTPPGSPVPAVNLNAVAYGLGRYVAVGGNFLDGDRGVIATSTDGLNWVPGSFFLNQTASNAFVTVAFGGGVFWAATPTRLYRSTTGTSFIYESSSGASGERILCFGNNRFVRVGDSLWVSTNGTSWVTTSQPSANPIATMSFGAGIFVATAGRDVASSVDGFNWIVRTNALPQGVSDVTFGNGVFMAVAGTNYFTSQPVAKVSLSTDARTLWVHGLKNRQYDILATNNLTATNWPARTRITLTNSPQPWTDPTSATNGSRFYRTSLVP